MLLKDRYDDGKISDGTLERPVVQRLLADIDAEIWGAVQERLIERSAKERGRPAVSAPSTLAGKIVDETEVRLTPSHANMKGRRYRYFVSHRLIAPMGEADGSGWRVPADRLENAVAEANGALNF